MQLFKKIKLNKSINWKQLFVAFGIVLITASATGAPLWWDYTGAIKDQKQQIDILNTQINLINKNIKRKQEEVKAKARAQAEAEAAAAQAAAEASKNQSQATTKKQSAPSSSSSTQASNSQILYFFSPLCYYSRQQDPIVESLASEGIKFTYMNVYANQHLRTDYNIVYTPTFILNGVRLEGFQEAASLRNYWNAHK